MPEPTPYEKVKRGQRDLRRGRAITPAHLAVWKMVGTTYLSVYVYAKPTHVKHFDHAEIINLYVNNVKSPNGEFHSFLPLAPG